MKYRESTTEFLINLKCYYNLDCTYLRILPSTIFEYLRISFWATLLNCSYRCLSISKYHVVHKKILKENGKWRVLILAELKIS